MKKKIYTLFISLTLSALSISCENFLEEKSDKQLAIPNTVADFKALLYHNNSFLGFVSSGEISSDDLYMKDEDYNALYYESDKRLYTWQPDYVSRSAGAVGNHWRDCYKAIYTYNSVIYGIREYNLTGSEVNEVKGQALVLRAARYLDAVQIWAPVYNKNTASSDLGLVIRLDPDMNLPSVRSSVQQTYDQIIRDLTEALPLLSLSSIAPNVPTKAAAYGLLARAYLVMGEYEKALENAESALKIKSTLIDFNGLNAKSEYPIPGSQVFSSTEVILLNGMNFAGYDDNPEAIKVTPSLYNLYQDYDLRKACYFTDNSDGTHTFKGTHLSWQLMPGITTAEMFLIVAECQARANNLTEASNAYNILRKKRWKLYNYSPIEFQDKIVALNTIMDERRRELAFRGLRWTDIKRLNRDGAGIKQTRTVKGKLYTLEPNDKKYAIAIPEDIIALAKIPQNPR